MLRPSLLVIALALCGVTTLHAQNVRVTKEADLAFPTLIAGVPATVQPGGAGSGRFLLSSSNGRSTNTTLTFTLSGSVQMGGSSMPVSFGPGSVGYSPSVSGTPMTLLDPRTPQTVTLGSNGQGYIFVGGTVSPSAGQAAGTYTTTISVSTK